MSFKSPLGDVKIQLSAMLVITEIYVNSCHGGRDLI